MNVLHCGRESVPVTKTPLPNVDNSIPWKIHSGEDYKRHVLFCGTEVIQTQAPNKHLVKAVVLRTELAGIEIGRHVAFGKPLMCLNSGNPPNLSSFWKLDPLRNLSRYVYTPAQGKIALRRRVLWRTENELQSNIAASMQPADKLFGDGHLILQQDLAPVHTAKRTNTWFKNNSISVLDWPAISSDVNPIDYLQGVVKRKMRDSRSHNAVERKAAIKATWASITPQQYHRLIASMPHHIDATGTLTEDGMELWGIVPSDKRSFQEVYLFKPGSSLPWSPVLVGMVSCHSLIFLDGKIQGDPLDLKMFEGTGWVLQDTDMKTKEDEDSQSYKIVNPGFDSEKVTVEGIAILHQFPFSSSLQRMSVIVEIMGEDEFLVFMKGAPEMVEHFCTPDTVPLNYHRELEHYTLQGFRVIALAYKTLATNNAQIIESLEREEVESDLVFLGFLIMENKLKPETKLVIQELTEAKIRTVMITGDNLQTACTIGKASGMIPPGSELIVIEANAPEGSYPASITWGSSEKIQDKSNAPQDCIKVSSSQVCALPKKSKPRNRGW
ncbi:unnamed protein product [Ranitomeya imitator]|uniref:Tc1-like transposase DDE domain-containing protein n=1 Tax=Ranitomeya imitator TaxID=111125 RepID=A0ABN9KYI6_9NEOB|nr:unnamed protein product [Ranitomeya imitator]